MKAPKLIALSLLVATPAFAEASKAGLDSISTPDKVQTSIGTLKSLDGAPLPETAKTVYDNPDTMPGKGWLTALRIYDPLEPRIDRTWRPGEIELVK